MIYLLTPTGNRYKAMRLLTGYMQAQTYSGDVTWIIVDDCDPPTPKPDSKYSVEMIRPAWRWSGASTQAKSILAGLDRIPSDSVVLMIEDDDCYLPTYIETMVKALESADLVGEAGSYYYNVRTGRYRAMKSTNHSSLASTAIRGTEALRAICEGHNRMIDVELWRTFTGKKALIDEHNVIGIKGLPGRSGIGVGHRQHFGAQDDGTVLKQWLGDYADNYRADA